MTQSQTPFYTSISLPRAPNGNVDWKAFIITFAGICDTPGPVVSISNSIGAFWELGEGPAVLDWDEAGMVLAALSSGQSPDIIGNPDLAYSAACDYLLRNMNLSLQADHDHENGIEKARELTRKLAEVFNATVEVVGKAATA